jgi:hypothetical protein
MAKIIGFRGENFKRLQVVELEIRSSGLTTLGGNNKQGKTSILDLIMNLVLGEKYTPKNALREGASKGGGKILLDNGGSISANYTPNGRTTLRIEGMEGIEGGPQAIVTKIFGEKALDVARIIHATDKKRTSILLDLIDVDIQPFEEKMAELEKKRLEVGRDGTKEKGYYETLPFNEDIGCELTTATELIEQQQAVLLKNAENQKLRDNLKANEAKLEKEAWVINDYTEKIIDIQAKLEEAKVRHAEIFGNIAIGEKTVEELTDESTDELMKKLEGLEENNRKVRENQDKEKSKNKMSELRVEYKSLGSQIEATRDEMIQLLDDTEMPLDDLKIVNGLIQFGGQAWDGMSTAEQYMVAAAIQAQITPESPILIVDCLETMDIDTLAKLGEWAEEKGYQIIGTRVSTGNECDYIIEDGMVAGETAPVEETAKQEDSDEFSF